MNAVNGIIPQYAGRENRNKKSSVAPTNNALAIERGNGASTSSQNVSNYGRDIALKTATIYIYGESERIKVLCLIDGGSQRTFVSKKLVKRLRMMYLGAEWIAIGTFGSIRVSRPKLFARRKVYFGGIHPGAELISLDALEEEELCSEMLYISTELGEELFQKGLQLADDRIAMKDSTLNEVSLLIGADYSARILTYHTIRHNSGTIALSSRLGSFIQGPTGTPTAQGLPTVALIMKTIYSEDLGPDLQAFFDLEHLGISDDGVKGKDDDPLERFDNEGIKMTSEGHYESQLPWIPEKKEQLKSNYTQAKKRLFKMMEKLRGKMQQLQTYDSILKEYEKEGFITKISPETSSFPQFYLPHHPVIREQSSTTKMRPVFDASARDSNGLSLNDCLHTGLNLNPELLGILLRFRMNPVAWIGDIEKAFLQIAIAPKDQLSSFGSRIHFPLTPLR